MWFAVAAVLIMACGGGQDADRTAPESVPSFFLDASIVVESHGPFSPEERVETRVRWWYVEVGRWRQDLMQGRDGAEDTLSTFLATPAALIFRDESGSVERMPTVEPAGPRFISMAILLGPVLYPDLRAFMASFIRPTDVVETTVEIVGREVVLGTPTTIIEVRPAAVSQSVGVTARRVGEPPEEPRESEPVGEGVVRYWVDAERMFVLRVEIETSDEIASGEVTELDFDPDFAGVEFELSEDIVVPVE